MWVIQKRKVTKAAGASHIWLPSAAVEEEEEENDEDSAQTYQAEMLAEVGPTCLKHCCNLGQLGNQSVRHFFHALFPLQGCVLTAPARIWNPSTGRRLTMRCLPLVLSCDMAAVTVAQCRSW